MTAPVIVIGCGGHAKVLIDALLTLGATVRGATDKDASLHGGDILGVPVFGGDDMIERIAPEDVVLVNGIGSVANTNARRKVYELWKGKGYCFGTVVHPAAIVGRDVRIGEGAQVMAGAVVQVGSTVGEDSIVNTSASVDHDCRIGAHCHIAPGAALCGNVTVGDCSHIGTGARVIQRVRIGMGALVAAGAVVTSDVKDGETVVGVPAKPTTKAKV